MIYTCTYNPAIDYKLELDSFTEGMLNRAITNSFVAGGKGINVSIVLNSLGFKNKAFGFVGGFTGNFVEKYLEEHYNLDTNFTRIKDTSRINVKMKSNHCETELNALGPFVTKFEMADFINQIKTLNKGDIIAIGGSCAKGEASNYISLIEALRELEVEFIVDSSNETLKEVLSYEPLLVKPNLNELCELFQTKIVTDSDIVKYANELLMLGAKNVIVSLGGNGSILVNNSIKLKAYPIEGNVINTVGAGDSMVAGFVAGFSEGLNIEDTYKLSIACGTATAFNQNLATQETVEEIIKKVRIEEL